MCRMRTSGSPSLRSLRVFSSSVKTSSCNRISISGDSSCFVFLSRIFSGPVSAGAPPSLLISLIVPPYCSVQNFFRGLRDLFERPDRSDVLQHADVGMELRRERERLSVPVLVTAVLHDPFLSVVLDANYTVRLLNRRVCTERGVLRRCGVLLAHESTGRLVGHHDGDVVRMREVYQPVNDFTKLLPAISSSLRGRELVDRIDDHHVQVQVFDPGLDVGEVHLLPPVLLREQKDFTLHVVFHPLQEALILLQVEPRSRSQGAIREDSLQTACLLNFNLSRKKRMKSALVLVLRHLRREEADVVTGPCSFDCEFP